MKKYVSNILKIIIALIFVLNIYISSNLLLNMDTYEYTNITDLSKAYDAIPYKGNNKEIIISKDQIEEYDILDTFIGELTAYGPDCRGCDGRGYTAQGYNIIENSIYYEDETFGTLRIVAADRKFYFGTVVRISGVNFFQEPFLAIVLDRGGAITGNKMDLAFETEKNPDVFEVGISRNVKYEVLRYGF